MGSERSYERHFRALRAGETTVAEFLAATAQLWRRMAVSIHRQWKGPSWLACEDTEQELRAWALHFVWEFGRGIPDPSRGGSVQRYVVWNAFDKAKKAMHKARRAKLSGNPDRAKSRVERPLSSFGRDEEGEHVADGGAVESLMFGVGAFTEPDQETRLIEAEEEQTQRVRAWSQASSFEEMRVMEVLAGAGSVEEAARSLMRDEGARAELELDDQKEAERVVRRAARAVAARMTRAA